jgi:glycopeptide antibiotics resistance protein
MKPGIFPLYQVGRDMNAKKSILWNRNNTFLGFIWLVIYAGILLIGLWPFNFWPENKVEWLKDQNGIHFYGQSIIYSEKEISNSTSFQSSSPPFSSITIEILVQPDRENFHYTPHILSLRDSKTFEVLFLEQWQSNLGIQNKILDPNKRWISKNIGLKNVLQKGRKRFISITSDDKKTSIYVDGKLARTYPSLSLLSSKNKTMSYDLLLLGNSMTGKQYWEGNLFGLAIYNRALTHRQIIKHFLSWSNEKQSSFMNEKDLVAFYPFNERSGNRVYDHIGDRHLLIPFRFEVLQKTILTPPWQNFRLDRSFLTDILTNILGFIPLGFFFSAYLWIRKSRSIYQLLFLPVLFAGFTSLAIELFQVYLPTRSSQLIDVITNILGTLIGVILFLKNRKSLRCNS